MTQSRTKGATAGEDLSGLLREDLSDRMLRDAAETEQIDVAYQRYLYRARPKKPGSAWLTESFLKETHQAMFKGIWSWAGEFRRTNLNIGVHWTQVSQQVKLFCDDFAYWEAAPTPMRVLEIAARLQNRLTRIHPFRNGNGRHARLITDIFLQSHGHTLPSWPQIQRLPQGDKIRETYIAAMKDADHEEYDALIRFLTDCL